MYVIVCNSLGVLHDTDVKYWQAWNRIMFGANFWHHDLTSDNPGKMSIMMQKIHVSTGLSYMMSLLCKCIK